MNRSRYTIDGKKLAEDDIFSAHAIYRNGWLPNDKVAWADRMEQWDRDKYNIACEKAFGCRKVEFNRRDLLHSSTFLSEYFGKDICCTGVEVNTGLNGYNYYTFYYREIIQ